MSNPDANRRGWYRLVYPETERPVVVLSGGATAVLLDCSEQGLRYTLAAGAPTPGLGARVSGEVRFSRARACSYMGTVVRVADGTVALRLDLPGLPFRVLLTEQRALRERYLHVP